MDRRSFLVGIAAAVGVAALPVISKDPLAQRSAVTWRAWEAHRLVMFRAQGTSLEAKFVLARLMRGEQTMLVFMVNTLGGMFQYAPPFGMELVGSDIEVECGDGALAAAVFKRPDGTYYTKVAGA